MRVFFHLMDGDETFLDREGVEVTGPENIREAIMADVRELVLEFAAEDRQGWRLHVTDDAGSLLVTVSLDGGLH